MRRYISGLIKIINTMSGANQPTSQELKEVKHVPWDEVFLFKKNLPCSDCQDEIIYYSGNAMFESIDNILQVLWNYKISHPTQFSLIPTLGGDQIEKLVGRMISEKPTRSGEDEL
eukprot:NODE_195_length_13287_cov_0.482484.p11 type:complete len:115 gc:universal NODE_195_length_13287_cov_0.482484:10658-11002(+)